MCVYEHSGTNVRRLDDNADPGGLKGLGDRHSNLFGQPLLNWRTNMKQVKQNKQHPGQQRRTTTLNIQGGHVASLWPQKYSFTCSYLEFYCYSLLNFVLSSGTIKISLISNMKRDFSLVPCSRRL